jgi:hypothetical protein
MTEVKRHSKIVHDYINRDIDEEYIRILYKTIRLTMCLCRNLKDIEVPYEVHNKLLERIENLELNPNYLHFQEH